MLTRSRARLVVVVACLAVAYGVRRTMRYLEPPHGNYWSIGIYTGTDPLHTRPAPGIDQPVLSASDVTDRKAGYVADPFMIPYDGTWYLFFEVKDIVADRGEIGSASSPDGLHWQYRRIVLDEPFHLSYPFVFRDGGDFYMIPESREGHGIRLYKAAEFPDRWEFVKEIVHGNYVDPCVVFYEGRWWLLADQDLYSLAVFYADSSPARGIPTPGVRSTGQTAPARGPAAARSSTTGRSSASRRTTGTATDLGREPSSSTS